jgi:hypothetical protein
MAYLNIIENSDLDEGIAEAGFDIFDDTDCNRIRIESDYYHSDIDCQLGDYTEYVEAELIDWLNKDSIVESIRELIAQDLTINVVYSYCVETNRATKFQLIVGKELAHEADD